MIARPRWPGMGAITVGEYVAPMSSDEPGSPQLLAIVRADIVGSTTTLTRQGLGRALNERRWLRDIAESVVTDSGGAIVVTEGDAVVAAWSSTGAAHAAAHALLEAGAAEGVAMRVGLGLGDVTLPRPTTEEAATLHRIGDVERSAAVGAIAMDDAARRSLAAEPAGRAAEVETRLRAAMFTALDGDREDTHALIEAAEATIDACVGSVVDRHGAGHVVVFPSCRSALETATRIQQHATSINLRAGLVRPVQVSVALALGEVATTREDTFGSPIVEAARLLDHADGATVCTDAVRVAGGLADDALDGASIVASLKGLPEPVEFHHVRVDGPAPLLPLPASLARNHRFAFVGRTDALTVVTAAWTEATAGRANGLVITGEEGSGKTRIAAELARGAFGDGSVVLAATCDEEVRVPYGPVAAALRDAAPLDQMVQDACVGRPGPLAPLFVAEGLTDVGARPVDRRELFDAVGAAFGRIAERRPVLMILDDIQWCDAESMQLVEFLLADPTVGRLMVLATCRVEEVESVAPVQRLLTQTRTLRRVRSVRLTRLSPEDVVSMLESHGGTELGASELEFASQLARTTGGNPLFVEEFLAHLIATGALVEDPGGWRLTSAIADISVPETLVELMVHRIDRLGASVVSTLAIAAVIGASFEAELVAEVLGRPIVDVLDVIDHSTRREIVSHDPRAHEYRFTDELTREAALRTLAPGQRSLAHRDVALALEAQSSPRIDALAHHWGAASGHDARDKAIHYLTLAARRDLGSVAWDSAVARARQLLSLLDQQDDPDDPRRAEAHYLLGAGLRMIGDDRYRSQLLDAAAGARRLRDGQLLARSAMATMRPGAWYPEAGLVDADITAMCEDALVLLAENDPLRALVLATLATNLAYDSDHERRWALVEEAQRLAALSGEPALIGAAAAAELVACQEPDLFVRRFELAQRVQQIGYAVGDRNLAFTGGFFVALEHLARGEVRLAERLAAEVVELADKIGTYWPRFLAAHFATMLAIARCDPAARDLIERERLMFEDDPVDTFGNSVIQQATVAMAEGTLSEMLLPFAEAIDQFAEYPDWVVKWNFAIAKAHLDAGDLGRAVEAVEVQLEPEFDRYWLPSLYQLGLLGLMLGRDDYCRRVLDALTPYRGRFAIIGAGATMTGQISTALGQAALGLGDLDAAEEFLREAAEQAGRAGFPFFEATARRFLATTLLRRDIANAEAARLLDDVDAAAARYGFALESAAVAELREEIAAG